jgi:hypothetical protein
MYGRWWESGGKENGEKKNINFKIFFFLKGTYQSLRLNLKRASKKKHIHLEICIIWRVNCKSLDWKISHFHFLWCQKLYSIKQHYSCGNILSLKPFYFWIMNVVNHMMSWFFTWRMSSGKSYSFVPCQRLDTKNGDHCRDYRTLTS